MPEEALQIAEKIKDVKGKGDLKKKKKIYLFECRVPRKNSKGR